MPRTASQPFATSPPFSGRWWPTRSPTASPSSGRTRSRGARASTRARSPGCSPRSPRRGSSTTTPTPGAMAGGSGPARQPRPRPPPARSRPHLVALSGGDGETDVVGARRALGLPSTSFRARRPCRASLGSAGRASRTTAVGKVYLASGGELPDGYRLHAQHDHRPGAADRGDRPGDGARLGAGDRRTRGAT